MAIFKGKIRQRNSGGTYDYLLPETTIDMVNGLQNELDELSYKESIINQNLLEIDEDIIRINNQKADKEYVDNNITEIDNVKASNSALAIERSRIDSLSTLTDGSTTGDAELIDTRIGEDGVTYPNAGSAVRGQFSKVKSRLGEYVLTEIPMILNRNINLNVGIGNVVNLNPENVQGYRYAVINCVEGELTTVNGAGGNNPRLWGFLDSNNRLLSVANANSSSNNNLLVLIAPRNARYLVINNSDGSQKSYNGGDLTKSIRSNRVSINDIKENISDLYDKLNIQSLEIDTLEGRINTVESTYTKVPRTEQIEVKLKNMELALATINGNLPTRTVEVQSPDKYNAWPFVEKIYNNIVVLYSKGLGHEDNNSTDVYKRMSFDGGISWNNESIVSATPGVRETVTGIGKDSSGSILTWIRKGAPSNSATFELMRSLDGYSFNTISTPTFAIGVSHIGDIFSVPTVGLMAFYYSATTFSWGIVKSSDNGVTWTQQAIETSISKEDCPSEISGVYIGDGKIIAIGRKEYWGGSFSESLFQIESSNYGSTWTKQSTNISDINLSTPSVLFNSSSGNLIVYYFQRGTGILRRREVSATSIWNNPTTWTASKIIAYGSNNAEDTGNVNSKMFNSQEISVYYSGNSKNTAVYMSIVGNN